MPRKQRPPKTITDKLPETEIPFRQGKTAKEAAKRIGVTEQTSYQWRNACVGVPAPPSGPGTDLTLVHVLGGVIVPRGFTDSKANA